MPFNYAPKLALAIRLVKFYGRPFTLIQMDSTPSDLAKPWRGTAEPRATPTSTLSIYGVFVEPESLERLGMQRSSSDFIKSTEQVMIVAHGSSLGKFDEVIDENGTEYKISNIQEMQPGGTIILHYIRMQRRGKTQAVRGALL